MLSRAPINSAAKKLSKKDIDLYADSIMASLVQMVQIQEHHDNDFILQHLKKYCVEGWPNKFSIDKALKPNLSFSGELSVPNELLLNRISIVIPKSLQAEILKKLHEGHLGITKCRAELNSQFGSQVSVKS